MAALDGTVAHAGGPGCAFVVGDDLDFNVAGALNDLLHKDGGVAECLVRFSPGALKGFRELVRLNSRGECRDRRLRQ